MTIINILSTIVWFFQNLFTSNTKEVSSTIQVSNVHHIINTKLANVIDNNLVLFKLNQVVDYIGSEANLSDKQIVKVLLEFLERREELENQTENAYIARKESHKGFLGFTYHLVTIINRETKEIQKYRTYLARRVSPEYINQKFGIYVRSIDDPRFEYQPVYLDPRKRFQKKKYTRNCCLAS